MRTSVIHVHDMLSVLSVDGVEQRIGEVPGVDSVTVNFAAGSATVRHDETRLDIADIRSAVRQAAYEPAAAAAVPAHEGHETHAAAAVPPTAPAASLSAPGVATAAAATPATPVAPAPDGDAETKDEKRAS